MKEDMQIDADAIRRMDGPGLTRLAWELGLAFPGVDLGGINNASLWYKTMGGWQCWQPHANLAQADAVFRSLRALGWYCGAAWSQLNHGSVNAYRPTDWRSTHIVVQFDGQGQETEPLALLRCAVLASASEKEMP